MKKIFIYRIINIRNISELSLQTDFFLIILFPIIASKKKLNSNLQEIKKKKKLRLHKKISNISINISINKSLINYIQYQYHKSLPIIIRPPSSHPISYLKLTNPLISIPPTHETQNSSILPPTPLLLRNIPYNTPNPATLPLKRHSTNSP